MATRSPWTPLSLDSGAVLANRFVLAPMTTDSAEPNGTVSDDELRYIDRRSSEGGFGGYISSCAYVHPDGRAWQGIGAGVQHLDSLTRVAAAFRRSRGLAILQLYDGGRIADPRIIGASRLRAPSAVPSARPGAALPRAMEHEEILDLIETFATAVATAQQAGFDGIELHGANHYLIHQFFSPRANRREDSWGGTFENRTRFAHALIAAARSRCGNAFTVGFRLNPFETEAGGFTLADTARLAAAIAEQGVDYVHISMDDFRRNSPQREDRDWTVAVEAPAGEPIGAIAAAVDGRCAVIASGGIRTLADAQEALARGADLVAVGRAALVDPDWLPKLSTGSEHAIRRSLPGTDQRIKDELTIPGRMAAYLLSRPGWIPREEKIRMTPALDRSLAMWLTTPNIAAAEIARSKGFGATVLDVEHGAFDLQSLYAFVPFLKALGFEVIAKVLEPQRGPIQQALDFGADAVVIPHIEGLEHARLVTGFAKFPPLGDRSFAGGRTASFGGFNDQWVAAQDRSTRCYPMVEDAGAFDDLEEILALETVDGVFVGPSDLSLRRGRGAYERTPGDFDDLRHIARVAGQAGKPWILPAWSVEEKRFAIEHGAAQIVATMEFSALAAGLAAAEQEMRSLRDGEFVPRVSTTAVIGSLQGLDSK